jgi:UDP-N-acetylmuramoylalanine-D-glutamate ligase
MNNFGNVLLVCGGREFVMSDFYAAKFRDVIERYFVTAVVHGGAAGADTSAGALAEEHGLPVTVYDTDWEKHGRAAGPIRSQRMLDEANPDLVLAFPGARGTADMVRRAKEAGVRVINFADGL